MITDTPAAVGAGEEAGRFREEARRPIDRILR
jgi:hypothetical protein